MKSFFNRSRTVSLCIHVFFLLLCLVLLFLACSGWFLMNHAPYVAALLAFLVSAGVFWVRALQALIKNKIVRGIILLLVCGLLSLVFVNVFFYGAFLLRIGNAAQYVYASPNGENRVLVIEGGFIDATVHAYPLHGIFYREQDNGELSYHDLWSTHEGRLIEVEWVSNQEAIVRMQSMNYHPNEYSNRNGEIWVTFD